MNAPDASRHESPGSRTSCRRLDETDPVLARRTAEPFATDDPATRPWPSFSGARRMRAGLLAAAVGAVPVAVFAVDAVGIVVFAEGGGLGALTGERGSPRGRPLLDAWGGAPALVAAIAGALSGARFAGSVASGGRTFDVRVVPLHDGSGKTCGAAGIAVGTERASRPDAGGNEARLLEALLESIPISIWILDARGGVVRDNALAREYGPTAVRAAEAAGGDGTRLVERVLGEGREGHGVARVRDPNGACLEVPLRGVPLAGEGGTTLGAVVLASPSEPRPAPPSIPDSLRLSLPPAVSVVEALPPA